MRKHPRLEELFLKVFILVDDWLKAHQERFRLPVQAKPVTSYSELFTIALVGELLAQPYESVWYWLVPQNHRDLFLRLPEYSLTIREDRGIELIDTKPLCIAQGKPWKWAKLRAVVSLGGCSDLGPLCLRTCTRAVLSRGWLGGPRYSLASP
ncbi:hypothetical protein, partial [Calidithermus timidus]|uniref:hypothetical protein n=1 Tax=Calidithermus timidus TaxID=307124 RepID=UPI003B83A2B0